MPVPARYHSQPNPESPRIRATSQHQLRMLSVQHDTDCGAVSLVRSALCLEGWTREKYKHKTIDKEAELI